MVTASQEFSNILDFLEKIYPNLVVFSFWSLINNTSLLKELFLKKILTEV